MNWKCSLLLCLGLPVIWGGTYYVALDGSNSAGNGSYEKPWGTVTYAALTIPDNGSEIALKEGIYDARISVSRRFTKKMTIRPERVYNTVLLNSATAPVITIFGGANIEIKGFEIKRPKSATGALVFQIQQGGGYYAEDIEIRDNIIHDSYNNDLLKINNGARRILVIGNIFYNQTGYDEHIDINGVTDVTVRKNIFFNDFGGSGRVNSNSTGSFIVIKNSAALPENKRINIQQNVFLNYQGAPSGSYVSVGEDGKPFFEAEDVLIENNLMLGNSPNTLRGPFTIQGSRRVTVRNNTIVGNLPARAYAMSIGRALSNPPAEDVSFYNNIWSDPTGTMEDFSDGVTSMAIRTIIRNNLYWNDGRPIPSDADILNIANDSSRILADPRLPAQGTIVLPRLSGGRFLSGNTRVLEEFERLVRTYGIPAAGSPVLGKSLPTQTPKVDILGRARGGVVDLGCFNRSSGLASPDLEAELQSVGGAEADESDLAPGKIARLTGEKLADDTATDLTVLVDGQPAELLAVSPKHVTFRLPEDAPLQGEISLARNGAESQPLTYSAKPLAPGIFAQGNQAVVADSRSGELITPERPVAAGQTVTVYAAGLKPAVGPVHVWFGNLPVEGTVDVEPTFPGLYLVQAVVPADVSGLVELSLEIGSVRSPAYKLAVTR